MITCSIGVGNAKPPSGPAGCPLLEPPEVPLEEDALDDPPDGVVPFVVEAGPAPPPLPPPPLLLPHAAATKQNTTTKPGAKAPALHRASMRAPLPRRLEL